MKLAPAFLLLLTMASAGTAEPPPWGTPSPYSLPWLLRPATPATVVRLDETLAFFEDPNTAASGATYVTSLTATYRLNPRFVPVFRLSFIHHHDPAPGPRGSGFSNPIVGVNYLRPSGQCWRWTGFLASSVPVGAELRLHR